MLLPSDYERFLRTARRHARRIDDAEDLLHDALLAAVSAGRDDLRSSDNRAWLSGAIRKSAAMQARSAVRRRNRERVAGRSTDGSTDDRPPAGEPRNDFLSEMPPALRAVATLVLHGMTRQEVTAALAIAPVTLRRRLSDLRRRLRDADVIHSGAAETLRERSPLTLGAIRQALLPHVRGRAGLATHDPDGHLLVLQFSSDERQPERTAGRAAATQ